MTVHLVPFGRPALEVLRDAVAAARTSPLDRVDVVVPSALAGVTLRRALARPGLAGVRFLSLPQLRRALEARAGTVTAPVGRPLRQARLRAQLASWPAPARTPSGVGVLDGLVQELEQHLLDEADLALLDQAGGRASQVVALYRAVRDEQAPPPRAVDPVVLHLPRRLPPADLALCRSLADQELLTVVLGLTGEDDVDAPVRDVAALLGDGAAGVVEHAAAGPRAVRVRLAPDPEEEVREAVRDVLVRLAAGAPPHRLALAYRGAAPYARLLHEQLHAAGVPHHVPRQRSLAQSLTGRLLLGLLDLPGQEWSRTAVLGWLGAAPVRLPDGSRPQVGQLDRLACEAGVTRGASRWRSALEALQAQDDGPQEDEPPHLTARRQRLGSLQETVARLQQDVEDLHGAGTWSSFAALCREVLVRWTGSPAAWTPAEQRAHDAVLAAVASLGALDDLLPPPALGTRLDALRAQLDAPVHEATGLGRGVLVAPAAELVGADLDLLVLVGMAEGAVPARLREHPLLRDDVRRPVGLRTTDERRQEERRDHLALLAAAPEVVLSAPVSDSRAQRPLHPSPWLLEHDAAPARPVSFAASLLAAPVPATAQEDLVRRLLTVDVDGLPAVLQRGLEAVDARRRGVLGPWLGGLTVATDPDVAARLARGSSATALQDYAVCPFRWFGSRVLGVRSREEPAEDVASPLRRGSMVHAVLEELVGAHLGRDPHAPWTQDEHDLAVALLEKGAQELVEQGAAGRPAVWEVRVAQTRRQLRRMLLADDAYRRERLARPQAVELAFGLDGESAAPADLALPSGRTVALRGSVDRVDVTDGGVVLVLDYKTGRSKPYGAFDGDGADLTDGGRRLQLPLYAEVARREHGSQHGSQDSTVEAYYVFVDEGGTRRGGAVGPPQRARLLEVLDVTTGGMADGVVPPRSGEWDAHYRSFENCGFCAFDRTCSAGRDDQWEAVREHPRVAPYAALAEGSS